jgi:hypothetical protein
MTDDEIVNEFLKSFNFKRKDVASAVKQKDRILQLMSEYGMSRKSAVLTIILDDSRVHE